MRCRRLVRGGGLIVAWVAAAEASAPLHEPQIRVAITPPWSGTVRVEGDALRVAGRTLPQPDAPTRTVAGPADTITLRRSAEGWEINGQESSLPFLEMHTRDGLYRVDGRTFSGQLAARLDEASQPRLLLQVPLEIYLLGVVSHEVDPTWSGELLKTQAVLARTYAYFKLKTREGYVFDVESTTQDQVFGGVEGINPGVERAVRETRGEVITYQGEPIEAFYHSTCGGHTEDAGEVFGERPYAAGRPDAYDAESPRTFWRYDLSEDQLEAILREAGLELGNPLEVEVLDRNRSGRVAHVMIKGPEGFEMMAGTEFRRRIGNEHLRSANYRVLPRSGGGIKFLGTGSGHGVGLCQWGAKTMAEKGFDHREIIGHYYTGVVIERIY